MAIIEIFPNTVTHDEAHLSGYSGPWRTTEKARRVSARVSSAPCNVAVT